MLFSQRHVTMILAGTKTQSRRAWKRPMVKVGGVYPAKLKMFDLNRHAPAWIRVTAIRKEKLGSISDSDAEKEGYSSPSTYFEAWRNINGRLDLNEVVTVIDFVCVVPGGSS